MRIIGGSLKGKRIQAPNNLPVRPTTDFAKEALFNILNNRVEFDELNAMDLFCGTGNLSYELASRGCESIVSVDKNFKCIQFVSKTSNELNLKISTIKSDVFSWLKRKSSTPKNLIVADPPYDLPHIDAIPHLVFENNWLAQNGLLVVEHGKETNLSNHPHFVEMRKYGHVHFSFFEWPTED
jgi:16S rRNA (guanine(966)-N(2))-methyltransferase RsmD